QRGQIVHVAANAAAPWMRDENENLSRQLSQAQQIDASREYLRRIVLRKRSLLFGIRRVQFRKCMLRALGKLVRRMFTERRVPQMSDEYVASDEMAKAGAVGAKAEIDLHTVVAAQQRRVERSNRGNALVTEIEARSVDHRQRDALTAIRMHEERVERRRRVTVGERMVVLAR